MKTDILIPTQLLAAARTNAITCELLSADTVPALTKGCDQYPVAEFSLRIQREADGETHTLREFSAWKFCTYSHGELRAVRSDEVTHGDPYVRLDCARNYGGLYQTAEGMDTEARNYLSIDTGEGMDTCDPLDITGLTDDEAEELCSAISRAVHAAYAAWEPEHASEAAIYDALTSQRRAAAAASVPFQGEAVRVRIYAGTHCGQPKFAIEDDEDKRVTEDTYFAARLARMALCDLLQDALNKAEELRLDGIAEELRASLRDDNK